MTSSNHQENIAAICYGIGAAITEHRPTMYEKWGDALEGQIGLLRYLIACADAFTAAESAFTERHGYAAFDWYLAIDGFVDHLMEVDDLPTGEVLQAVALRYIEANGDAVEVKS